MILFQEKSHLFLADSHEGNPYDVINKILFFQPLWLSANIIFEIKQSLAIGYESNLVAILLFLLKDHPPQQCHH